MCDLAAFKYLLTWFADLDIHIREVLKGTSVAFALKVLAAGLGFGLNVLIARQIGAEGAGIFYLALTVITIATVIGRMGLDNALLRFVAANAVEGRWDKVYGVYRKGMMVAAFASTIAVLVVAGAADWIASALFSKPALAQPLRLMSFSILPTSLLTLYAQLLIGLKKIGNALLVDGVSVPFVIILLLLLLGRDVNANALAMIYVASTVVVLVLGMMLWRRALPRIPTNVRSSFETRTLLSSSMPLLLVASMSLIMSSSSTFILGVWGSTESVGIFSAAARTATLIGFVLTAVNPTIAPKFAELHAQKDYVAMGNLARSTAKLLSLSAAPVCLLFLIAPKWMLGLFGPEFRAGAVALMILAVGQFVNVATGAVGYVLMMSGHEKLVRNTIAISAVTNFALNIILIPRLDIVGAAIATAVSLGLANIIAVILAYRKLSIISIPIPNIARRALSHGKYVIGS